MMVVRCDNSGNGGQAPSAEDLAFDGQTPTLVVSEAEASRSLCRTENAVLLDQIVNDSLLPVDPTREQQKEEDQRRWQRIHTESEACPRSCAGSRIRCRGGHWAESHEVRALLRLLQSGVLASAEFSHRTGSLALGDRANR
jgi:hypothetical protein